MAGSLPGSLPVALFYSLFVDDYVLSLTDAVKEEDERLTPPAPAARRDGASASA